MIELKKICPKSGKRCDCPKGICNRGHDFFIEPKLYHEQAHEHYAKQSVFYAEAAGIDLPCKGCGAYGFAQSKLGPTRCEFCDGTYSGNPPAAEEIYEAQTPDEQSRIDQQEALSLKYSLCTQVLLLSSGKFALFGPYSMQDGIPLLAIDTWEGLEPHVRAYRKAAEDAYTQEKRGEHATRASADYDSLFGDQE